MSVSIVWYILFAISCFCCCLASQSSRVDEDNNNTNNNNNNNNNNNQVKSKDILRHQQQNQHRPAFIERRLTFEPRVQHHQRYNAAAAAAGGAVASSANQVHNEEAIKDYYEEQEQSIPEVIIEKASSGTTPTPIRHGRSRSHLPRAISRLDELENSAFSKGRSKSIDKYSIGVEHVGANETLYPDFEDSDSLLMMRDEYKVTSNSSSPERIVTITNSGSSGVVENNNFFEDRVRKVYAPAGYASRRRSRDNSTWYNRNKEHRTAAGGGAALRNNDETVTIDDRVVSRAILDGIQDDIKVDRGSWNDRNSSLARINDEFDTTEDYEEITPAEDIEDDGSAGTPEEDGATGGKKTTDKQSVQVDIVTRFLRIIENQHFLGENCTAGTDLNLGEGVVDRYAQERFRLEANLAVNRANMLTRLWKYAPDVMLSSEYLLHASILSMVEFDEDIFAAGNCYDKLQYRERWLYCPFAHRLQDQDGVLVKDLAVEYKYLTNSSEWFYIARKNAERVIASNDQFSRGYHTYTHNESSHTSRVEDEILTVKYEDGRWSKPYYDCGGGNIWMLTYTVPFFGYMNDTYFFKGTSGIDIDLRRVDIDQCPLPPGSTQLNIFAASDKCKNRTTECVAIPGLGFRRGSYRCVCKRGFYYPDTKSIERYYNGTVIEEEYEKLMLDDEDSQYSELGVFECLPCAEGCEYCEDGSPCVVSLNWLMRTAILILECCIIACLPAVILFTWKFGNVKVVRAASPVLLRVIVLGAFFIYSTTIVMYPRPNVVTCTIRVWLREIGFSLTYGALMLKTWRISVIFRVKSAKAVKITDMNLLKRLGIIVTIFAVFLGIRTLVAPPVVIVGRTADDLKAYLCRTDWWDHSFTTLEVMFLVWGIRLCIVVRKAPSEFNESRFISMAIYNEFLLSVFLNVSMLFLQSPANPDLLYIIFFCHTQLTVTLLLCLIFGSKAYVVFRGGGKEDAVGKLQGTTGKFFSKTCRTQGTSNQTNSISLQQGNFTEEADGVTEEFRRLYAQLELLKEKNMRLGNRHLVTKIQAMQEASSRSETQVSTIQGISSCLRLSVESGEATEVKSVDICHHHNRDPSDSLTRRKGEKKKLLELKNETEKIEEPQGDKHRESCATENREEYEKKPEGAKDEKELLARNGGNDDNVNHQVVLVESDDEVSDVTAVGGGGPPTSQKSKSQLSTAASDNVEEQTGLVSASTTRINPVTATPAAGNIAGSNGESNAKERGKNKSGHARTHAIVINLDDKSRFSEEVTV